MVERLLGVTVSETQDCVEIHTSGGKLQIAADDAPALFLMAAQALQAVQNKADADAPVRVMPVQGWQWIAAPEACVLSLRVKGGSEMHYGFSHGSVPRLAERISEALPAPPSPALGRGIRH